MTPYLTNESPGIMPERLSRPVSSHIQTPTSRSTMRAISAIKMVRPSFPDNNPLQLPNIEQKHKQGR
jgi:hypothetical protein